MLDRWRESRYVEVALGAFVSALFVGFAVLMLAALFVGLAVLGAWVAGVVG